MKKITLANVKGGAPEELFQREVEKVLENFRDPNTDPEAPREINLKFKFLGHKGSREELAIDVTSAAKLAPVLGVSAVAFVGRGEDGEFGFYTHDVRQEELGLVDRGSGEITPITAARQGQSAH